MPENFLRLPELNAQQGSPDTLVLDGRDYQTDVLQAVTRVRCQDQSEHYSRDSHTRDTPGGKEVGWGSENCG